MDHAGYCDALADEIARFAATVRGADPATPVPTCPGWDLGRLVKHVGTVHRWVERMVREAVTTPIDQRTLDLGLPDDRAAYPDWVLAGAGPLVETLRGAEPDRSMWAWGADQHARFWSRRMLHETAVHRADAALALGEPFGIDAALAVDAIDELLDNLPPAASFAPGIARLRGDGESIHLHCTDTDGEWMIRLVPEGFTWEHGHGKGSVAVRGAAADLLLLAYRRIGPDDERFARFGDTALLDRWLASSGF
jgi:uncharacterized protein (TIGR03083 family)